MPHLHVALVTERPEASLIPLLQLRPQRVVLVAGRQQQQTAERLQILLQHELSSHIEIHRWDKMPERDPQRLSEFATRLAQWLSQQQHDTAELEVTYDLADSDKLTALLFQKAMSHCKADWLYVDSRAGALYRMGPGLNPSTLEAVAIEPVLDVDTFLQANGRKRIKALSDNPAWRSAAKRHKTLTRYLGHQTDKLAWLLSELHERVHGSHGVLVTTDPREGPRLAPSARQQRLSHVPHFPCTDALSELNATGMLEWSSSDPQRVSFSSLAGALYLGGGWLTEYAWLCAQEVGLHQACCGAHVLDLSGHHNGEPVVSDCLAVHHNQLLFIECLTTLPGPEACLQQGLKQLHDLLDHSAGLASTRLLLACGEFDRSRQRLTDLQHSQGLEVAVIECDDLKQLPVYLRHWMETGRWPQP
ncbi:DUF1887 family protein [Halomonas sp. DQ26W]|uniref:Card1-like endonuclease domain-containing protein n=1 Tax=Halomonas sp. DQ26W TaxID=2282311 RepID=UPI000DF859C7|nr:DUF1887 family CARF protein [Halomonas sp. DQ26W]RDB44167.1 DUF1887 family protein [Halomonas sp. DQ26W]